MLLRVRGACNRQFLALVFAAGFATATLSSCSVTALEMGSGSAAAKVHQDAIVFGLPWEPVSFYPIRALDSASYYAQSLVYEGLVRYNEEFDIVPGLAESFRVSEDGLTYRFILRRQVQFSDGENVTCEDVLSSIRLAQSPLSPFQADYENIRHVDIGRGDEIVVTLDRPCAPLLSRLVELRILPAKLIDRQDRGRYILARSPVASGPYQLARWESGLELVFEENPRYWGRRPSTKKLIWRVVPDKTLIALALRHGELDVAQVDPSGWQSSLAPSKEFALDVFTGSRTVYLGFNNKRSPFDDRRVRQALSMAVDRKAISERIYGGYAVIPSSDVSPGNWVFNPRAKLWPYDPDRARALLQEAGFRQAGATWKRRRPGVEEELAFRIFTVRDFQDIAQAVAEYLGRIGIRSEIQVVEFSTLRQRYLNKSDFDAVIWSRSAGPDPECVLVWGSGGSLNFVRFEDRRVDELIKQGRLEDSESDRKEAYREIQNILAEEQPWVFITQPKLLIGHKKLVVGVQSDDQARKGLPWDNPLFNASRWRWQGEQKPPVIK